MPIHCALTPQAITKEEYHLLDYEVMGMAFDIHRDLGRLLDEKVYQNELAHRCSVAGMTTATEVPICLTAGSFSKTLLMDFVIEQSIVYELKTANSFCPEHRRQVLDYMFLTQMRWGKLVNMRQQSVRAEYISTSLTEEERRKVNIDTNGWVDQCAGSRRLRDTVLSLLEEWGAFLSARLYSEAAVSLMGEDVMSKRVPIKKDGRVLGTQHVDLLNPATAILFSAVRNNIDRYESHVLRLTDLMGLSAVQWINLAHQDVTFRTPIH
jgi:GxxExxY protein